MVTTMSINDGEKNKEENRVRGKKNKKEGKKNGKNITQKREEENIILKKITR